MSKTSIKLVEHYYRLFPGDIKKCQCHPEFRAKCCLRIDDLTLQMILRMLGRVDNVWFISEKGRGKFEKSYEGVAEIDLSREPREWGEETLEVLWELIHNKTP